MVWKKHSVCAGSQGLIVKGISWLLKLKWEAQGKKKWDARPSRAQGEKSAEITLFFLYGFLDAEQHGSEPLVQPWNGVKFFHLPIPEEILAKITTQNITGVCTFFFASKEKPLCWSKLVYFNWRKVRKWKSIFCLKMTDLQSQCRHPRSVLHMHLEVSRSQRRTLLLARLLWSYILYLKLGFSFLSIYF